MTRVRRPAGRRPHPVGVASTALALLAACAVPAAATSYLAPLVEQSDRERYEALVNGALFVCEARLDSSIAIDGGNDLRVFLEDPVTWKGAPLPARFEVRVANHGGNRTFNRLEPGTAYRLFLRRGRAERSRDGDTPSVHSWYEVAEAGTAPDLRWWWSYPRATVDTIVARSRLDTLLAQAEFVILAHREGVKLHERDGRLVSSAVLGVDRVLKGVPPADTLVYQSALPIPHPDRSLLFLKRHGPDIWEPVWPGAGVYEFDSRDRETRTGESLQSFLEELARLAERAAKH